MSEPTTDIARYIGNIEQFPILAHWDFYQHAGASPLPKVVADAVRKYANGSEAASYLNDHRYTDLDKIRAAAAGMINAGSDEIALLKNTAEGISIVAAGADFQPGDRIVTAAGEYPANVYPWMDAAQRHKLQLIFVPESTSPTGERSVPLQAILDEAAKPRTKVVALSHVEYATGQRYDLQAIGKFCRERNIRFCVDAIQSLGALPVDVQSMSIDYLAAGGQKWMLAPEGSAMFYCRRDLIDRTPPLVIGAVNVINNLAYGDYDFTLQKTAGRFESGTYAMPSLFGFWAAIDLLAALGSESDSSEANPSRSPIA